MRGFNFSIKKKVSHKSSPRIKGIFIFIENEYEKKYQPLKKCFLRCQDKINESLIFFYYFRKNFNVNKLFLFFINFFSCPWQGQGDILEFWVLFWYSGVKAPLAQLDRASDF